jgi:hypothetical protein
MSNLSDVVTGRRARRCALLIPELILAGLIGGSGDAEAQDAPPVQQPSMLPVVEVIAPRLSRPAKPKTVQRIELAIGPATEPQPSSNAQGAAPTTSSERTVSGDEVNARPFSRPAEALEVASGLIVTQHSGDGKANQYFLRGFNLDHGTDLAIFVDNM